MRSASAGLEALVAAAVLAGAAVAPARATVAAPAVAPAAALAPWLAVEWPDQLGGRDSLGSHAGQRVVLVVIEARRLALAGRWAEALAARVPGLTVLTLADAPPDVPVDPDRFTALLRKRVPAGVRVWMDPRREFSRALVLDTREPNLLVVAPDGSLAAQFRGRAAAPLLDTAVAAVLALPPATTGEVSR